MVRNKQARLNLNHFEASITAIDTHTQGEPTRIILDGFPEPKGDTMLEKMQDVAKNHDHYRSALMDEPRGHKDMFGALLTKPIDPKADFGVIFMEGTGYMPMCGHGSMGAATALVEAGLVEVSEPYTAIILEAPAGLIEAKVAVEEGKAKEVRAPLKTQFCCNIQVLFEVEMLLNQGFVFKNSWCSGYFKSF